MSETTLIPLPVTTPDPVPAALPPVFRLTSLSRMPLAGHKGVRNEALLYHDQAALRVVWLSAHVDTRIQVGRLAAIRWLGKPTTVEGAIRISRLVMLDRPEAGVDLFRSQALLHDLIGKVTACDDDVLQEGGRMQMWEFASGQARDFDDLFSVIAGQYVKEISLRDPYCGAFKHQRKLGDFLKAIHGKASTVKRIFVKCKEVADRDGEVEFYLDIERRVDDLIKALGVEDRDVDVSRIADRRKSVHDRELDITVTISDGCDVLHRYFLTGGVDLLMSPQAETRVFYIRLEK